MSREDLRNVGDTDCDIFERVFGGQDRDFARWLEDNPWRDAQGDGAPLAALMGVGDGARAALAGVRHLLGRGERTEVFGAELPFALRAAHGAFLRVAADGAVKADGTAPAEPACVFVVQKGGVALHMRCTLRAQATMRRLARLPDGQVRACGGTQAGAGAPDAERWLVQVAATTGTASQDSALVWLRCRRPGGGGDWDHALAAAPDGAVRVAPWAAGGASPTQLFRMLDPGVAQARADAQRAAAAHAAAEAAARERAAALAAALAATQLEAERHAAQREAALRAAGAPPATHVDVLRAAARHMREALGHADAAVEGDLVVAMRAVAAAADPAPAAGGGAGAPPTRRGPVMQLVGDAAPPSPLAGRELLFFSVGPYEEEARAVARVRGVRLFAFDAHRNGWGWTALDAA